MALGAKNPPKAKVGSAKVSVSSMEGVEEVIEDEVFNPGNRTTADLSVSTDELFELALQTGTYVEALNAAESDEQRRRVWAEQEKVAS